MQYKVLYFFVRMRFFFHGAFPKISEGDDDLYIGMPSYRRHFVSQSGVGKAAVSDFFVSWSDQTLKPYRNTMKFFVDTANLDQIREAHAMGVLDGVTTNPSLMARENIRGEEACRRHYVEICRIVQGDVSAEVISTDFEGMVREGEALAAPRPAYRRQLAVHGRGNSRRPPFRRTGHPHQLHAGLLRRAGAAGRQGGRYLRFAFRRPSGRHFGRRRGAWWRISSASIGPTGSGRRCWRPRSATRAISSSASMPEPMWRPARSRRSRAAPPSAHGERAGAVPGGSCPGERIARRADGTEGRGCRGRIPAPLRVRSGEKM